MQQFCSRAVTVIFACFSYLFNRIRSWNLCNQACASSVFYPWKGGRLWLTEPSVIVACSWSLLSGSLELSVIFSGCCCWLWLLVKNVSQLHSLSGYLLASEVSIGFSTNVMGRFLLRFRCCYIITRSHSHQLNPRDRRHFRAGFILFLTTAIVHSRLVFSSLTLLIFSSNLLPFISPLSSHLFSA